MWLPKTHIQFMDAPRSFIGFQRPRRTFCGATCSMKSTRFHHWFAVIHSFCGCGNSALSFVQWRAIRADSNAFQNPLQLHSLIQSVLSARTMNDFDAIVPLASHSAWRSTPKLEPRAVQFGGGGGKINNFISPKKWNCLFFLGGRGWYQTNKPARVIALEEIFLEPYNTNTTDI